MQPAGASQGTGEDAEAQRGCDQPKVTQHAGRAGPGRAGLGLYVHNHGPALFAPRAGAIPPRLRSHLAEQKTPGCGPPFYWPAVKTPGTLHPHLAESLCLHISPERSPPQRARPCLPFPPARSPGPSSSISFPYCPQHLSELHVTCAFPCVMPESSPDPRPRGQRHSRHVASCVGSGPGSSSSCCAK